MTNTVSQLVKQFKAMFMWWLVVAPWEQAIRVRLGTQTTLLHGGWHWRIPLVHRTYLQTTRLRRTTMPHLTMTTKDKKVLVIKPVLGYAIADLEKLYQSLHHAEDTIRAEVMATISSFVSERDLDELSPSLIEVEVAEILSLERYGLDQISVQVVDYVSGIRIFRLLQGGDWGQYGTALTTEDYLEKVADG